MKGKSITCGKVLSEILKEKKNVKASSSEQEAHDLSHKT